MNDAEIRFKVNMDSGEAESKVSSLKATTVAAGNLMASAIKTAASAIIDLGKEALNARADYEQLVGGVDTLFKDSSDKVQEYASQAYKTAGISANEYMEQATSFSASLIQSLDGDTAKAAETTNMAIVDMADNSNKMGTSLEAIQNAYAGFSKQNYTMLDNLKLGYGGTKTEMERLLSDAQKITGVKYDINSLDDVYNAIHVIQTEMGITGTTQEEASSTITGSINQVKAAWTDFLSGEGGIESVVESVVIAGQNIIPAITQMLPSLISGVVSLVNALIPMIPSILQTVLPSLINGIQLLITGIIQALPTLIIAIADMLPELIPTIVDAILQIIPVLIDNMPLFLKAGAQLVGGLLEGIIKSVPKILAYIPKMISSMIGYYAQMPSMMLDIGKNLVKGLWNGISDVTEWIYKKIQGFGDKVISKIKGIFGIHSPSKVMFEIGGYIDEGFINGIEDMQNDITKTVDGTFGLDNFDSLSTDINTTLGFGTYSGSSASIINVSVNADMAVDEFGRAFVNDIKTFSGGTKNDYNYGGTL